MLPRTIQAAGSRVLHWFVVTLPLSVTRVTDERPRATVHGVHFNIKALGT